MLYENSDRAASEPDKSAPESTIALVDCDNFFTSCERVFDPRLREKPLVVLSSNDGVIISRSPEAKALGIKMAVPFFQVENIIKAKGVRVLSANFALYGDMSRRVIAALREFCFEVEVYSIDEAFLSFDGFAPARYTRLAREIRTTVLQWTGISTSIGVATTKTLAKAAAEYAKKHREAGGIFNLLACTPSELETTLKAVPVEDVWGIGRQLGKWLQRMAITNSWQLRNLDDSLMRRKAGVSGLRVVHELRGILCSKSLAPETPPRQTITSSRSFGTPVYTLDELRESIAVFASQAGAKLRRDKSVATSVSVFVITKVSSNGKKQTVSETVSLKRATNCDDDIIKAAVSGLKKLHEPNRTYYKAGLTLLGLSSASAVQTDLLLSNEDEPRHSRLSRVVDQVNKTIGDDILHFGVSGSRQSWRARSVFRSPGYTTNIDEIPPVRPVTDLLRRRSPL